MLKESADFRHNKNANEAKDSNGACTANTQPDSLTKQEVESPTDINNVPKVPRLNSPFSMFDKEKLALKKMSTINNQGLFMNSPKILTSPSIDFNPRAIKSQSATVPLQLSTAKGNNPNAQNNTKPSINRQNLLEAVRQKEVKFMDNAAGKQTDRLRPSDRMITNADLLRSNETPTGKLGFHSPVYNDQRFTGFTNGIIKLQSVKEESMLDILSPEYGRLNGRPQTKLVGQDRGHHQNNLHTGQPRLMRSTSTPHHNLLLMPQLRQQPNIQRPANAPVANNYVRQDTSPSRKIKAIFDSVADNVSNLRVSYDPQSHRHNQQHRPQLYLNATSRGIILTPSQGLNQVGRQPGQQTSVYRPLAIPSWQPQTEYQQDNASQRGQLRLSSSMAMNTDTMRSPAPAPMMAYNRGRQNELNHNVFASFMHNQQPVIPEKVATPLANLYRVDSANNFRSSTSSPTRHLTGQTQGLLQPSGNWQANPQLIRRNTMQLEQAVAFPTENQNRISNSMIRQSSGQPQPGFSFAYGPSTDHQHLQHNANHAEARSNDQLSLSPVNRN